jgi:hypothetical protein
VIEQPYVGALGGGERLDGNARRLRYLGIEVDDALSISEQVDL